MIIHTHRNNTVKVTPKADKKFIEPASVASALSQELPQKEKASKKIRKRHNDIIITDPVPPIELPQEAPIDVPVEDNINE